MAALGGQSPQLPYRPLDVEKGEDATWDEAVRIGAAPFLDVPIVVRLDHHFVDVRVGTLIQDLAGEPGPVREVEPGQLPARVHIAYPLVHVVTTGTHLVVPVGVHVEELFRLAGYRIQPE